MFAIYVVVNACTIGEGKSVEGRERKGRGGGDIHTLEDSGGGGEKLRVRGQGMFL